LTVRRLEELNHNAWPGLRGSLVDGWLVRFGGGFTRRANSVLPLYPGVLPLEERIGRCEALLERAGLPPCFKMFPHAEPAGLDEELARRGYARVGVGTLRILEQIPADQPRLPEGFQLSASPRPTGDWLACFAGGRNLAPAQVAAAQGIMDHIEPERRCLLVKAEDGPAACALVVAEDGWACISCVGVRADLRGRGLGRRIMELAHAQAAGMGARNTYLMVLDDNPVAGRLYQSMGYRVAYPTWGRVKLPKA
jgi:GNAT superfamily N-acetyltransferase